MTLLEIRNLVRTLTGIQSTDILTTPLLNVLVNESLFEVYRSASNSWGFNQTALSSDGSTPPFEAQFHGVVVYRTAAKVLAFTADTTPRGQAFMAEYDALLFDMKKYYFSQTTYSDINSFSSITELIQAVRAATKVYDDGVANFSTIQQIINVAYNEFTHFKKWNFYKRYAQVPLSSFPYGMYGFSNSFVNGATSILAHQLVLNENLTTPGFESGLVKILEVYLVNGGVEGFPTKMIYTDSLSNINFANGKIYYTVSIDPVNDDIRLYFAPEQYDNDSYVRMLFNQPLTRALYSEFDEETSTVIVNHLEIPAEFQMIIVYRAAQFLLMQVAPEDPRIDSFEQMYGTMLQSFINYDQLSCDNSTFSIGEQGKDSPTYNPLFSAS